MISPIRFSSPNFTNKTVKKQQLSDAKKQEQAKKREQGAIGVLSFLVIWGISDFLIDKWVDHGYNKQTDKLLSDLNTNIPDLNLPKLEDFEIPCLARTKRVVKKAFKLVKKP